MNIELYISLVSQTPELAILLTAIALLLIDSLVPRISPSALSSISILGSIAALFLSIIQIEPVINQTSGFAIFNGMAAQDGIACFARLTIVFTLLIGQMMAHNIVSRKQFRSEYHSLVLFSAAGAIILANSSHLVTLVLGLEILSLPLYTLAAFDYQRKKAREAGLKYLILGAFASGFLVFGCALFYAASGTMSITNIPFDPANSSLFASGCVMILAGLMFKGGLLPFFAWSPDVYEGAPDFAVGIMAALAKTGTFILLVRLMPEFLSVLLLTNLMPGLLLIAAGTMLAGNLLALRQSNIKRMLAYSSVAHAGYMFLGLLAFRSEASSGVLAYLLVYAPVLVTSFQMASLFPGDESGHELSDYSGLGQKAPLAAVLFSIMLFSLAGLPPTGGFIAKAITFYGVVKGELVSLLVFAMLVSLIGVYYYLRVIVYMFMNPSDKPVTTDTDIREIGRLGIAGLWLSILVIFIMGFIPSHVLNYTFKAVEQLQNQFSIFPR